LNQLHPPPGKSFPVGTRVDSFFQATDRFSAYFVVKELLDFLPHVLLFLYGERRPSTGAPLQGCT
jgi:hypothetical protein